MGIAARRVLGAAGDNFIRVVVVVGLLSSVNAMEMATSRALYAMSRDALFFPFFARVNAGGIPAPSLWLSTAVGLCFAMFSFERVAAILASFFVADYALSFVSLFVLRRRMPESRAAVSRLGLSVDHVARPRRLDRVSGRGAGHRSRKYAANFYRARRQLPGVPRAQVGVAPKRRPRRAAVSRVSLILCGRLHMIYYRDIHGTPLRLQLEPKLVLQRFEERCSRVAGFGVRSRSSFGRPLQGEIAKFPLSPVASTTGRPKGSIPGAANEFAIRRMVTFRALVRARPTSFSVRNTPHAAGIRQPRVPSAPARRCWA